MIKKIIKWVGIALISVFCVLLVTPFIFKGKIQELVKSTVNKQVNADVDFSKVSLSLLRNFPKASISISDLKIVNKAPFENDTLLYAKDLAINMSVLELFNGSEKPMQIQRIAIEDVWVNVIVDLQGNANYDIMLSDSQRDSVPSDNSFSLALNEYTIKNARISYIDYGSDMQFVLNEFSHKGRGDLVANNLDLDTYSQGKVSFVMNKVNYLNDVNINLQAVIGMDMQSNTYTFKQNQLFINQLPLSFDGWVTLEQEGQKMDLSFSTPDADFKNFLGLVPITYAQGLDKVQTQGSFSVEGKIQGELTQAKIPTFNIIMQAHDAYFKFDQLPKAVDKIGIDVLVANTTGLVKDTSVDVNNFTFSIDKDHFLAQAKLRNITQNMLVWAAFQGVINLSNISQAYPIQTTMPLKGILNADLKLDFDMASVESKNYQKINNSGHLSLKGFEMSTEALANPVYIALADLSFNTQNIRLNSFTMRSKDTDIEATGRIDNFYGFLFKNQTLQGNFNVNSNNFIVSDLLVAEPEQSGNEKQKTVQEQTSMKIPAFLDCTINATAGKVVYDNLVLQNVKGKLIVKDQKADLQNMSTDIFDGSMRFKGNISTLTEQPSFDMDLSLDKLDVVQTFSGFNFLTKVAPIASMVSGNVNGSILLNGALDPQSLSPITNTLSGDIRMTLGQSNVDISKSKVLSLLNSQFKFLDAKALNLNDKTIHIVFDKGKVQVKPFDVKLNNIAVVVSGEHGFDQSMDYVLDFKIPAKMLGNDIASTLAKLSNQSTIEDQLLPIKVDLTGNFSSPKIGTNLNAVVADFTKQIVEQQKNNLVDKGKNALTDLLGTTNKKQEMGEANDSISLQKKEQTKETVDKIGQGIKDLFKKK